MSDHREITVTASTTSNSSSSNDNPYIYAEYASAKRPNPINTLHGVLNYCGEKVEKATKKAVIIGDHLRASPNGPIDAALTKLNHVSKLLECGGREKLFQQTFGVFPEEKLLRPFACYISTNSGPVSGTLYVSTKRLAFCSDRPLSHHQFSSQHRDVYYKVVVQLDQLSRVSRTTKRLNPTEKLIQIVTMEGYEINFMGFISYDNALKTISEALKPQDNRVPVYFE